MTERQENQKILMATHLPTFQKLGIIDPFFVAKSAWAPPGEELRLQIFPSEFERDVDIYTEFSDFKGKSEDPTHTLYKLKHNPFYKEEYPFEEKRTKDGREYGVYLVGLENLVAVKPDGKEVPYNEYQEQLKNPQVETKPADFPNFAEEYLNVGLKKKEEEVKPEEEMKNFPEWLNTLDRIASALEKIEKKI